MGLLKDALNKLKDAFNVTAHGDADTDLPEPPAIPDASVFAAMEAVHEAEFPIPETAPVVATGSAIRVGRPLRFKAQRKSLLT
jgi:hypothetical protein